MKALVIIINKCLTLILGVFESLERLWWNISGNWQILEALQEEELIKNDNDKELFNGAIEKLKYSDTNQTTIILSQNRKITIIK